MQNRLIPDLFQRLFSLPTQISSIFQKMKGFIFIWIPIRLSSQKRKRLLSLEPLVVVIFVSVPKNTPWHAPTGPSLPSRYRGREQGTRQAWELPRRGQQLPAPSEAQGSRRGYGLASQGAKGSQPALLNSSSG